MRSQIPVEQLGLALLRCLWSCIRCIYWQGRFSYVPQHQSVRVGVQPCGRAVSCRLHQAFACYRNNITSWTMWAHRGLLLRFSTSLKRLFLSFKVIFWKKKKIEYIYILYLFSSQRHVKTPHADKWVPMELKATSLLIALTLAWISGTTSQPSTFTTAKNKRKKSGKKRIHTLKGSNESMQSRLWVFGQLYSFSFFRLWASVHSVWNDINGNTDS